MLNRFPKHALLATLLLGTALPAFGQEEEGDGAPHLAIVQDGNTFEIEFEVTAGLDTSGLVAALTLDASALRFGQFQTLPLNDTPSPNDDLGFVSEVEGGPEGGVLDADIVVRRLAASDNFLAFDAATPLFTAATTDLVLNSSFDFHPTYALTNAVDDFTPATASFEVFNVRTGAIGAGAESIGRYDLVLVVPEPATATLALGLLAPLAMRRRRAR